MSNMPLLPEYDPISGRTHLSSALALGPQPGRIQICDLKEGDVLVWYAAGGDKKVIKLHSGIREYTEGAYSHVGLYVGNGLSVDAGLDGVSENTVKNLIDDFELGRVLRFKALGRQRQEAVVKKARSFIGFHYAHIDAIGMYFRRLAFRRIEAHLKCKTFEERLGKALIFIRRFMKSPRKKVFCSQLVLEAYGAAEIYDKRQVNSAALSPNDFIENGVFEYVGFLSKNPTPVEHPQDLLSSSPDQVAGYWRPSPIG